MSLYQSAVKKPIMTALVFVAIAIIGVYSLSKLPVDLLPDMGSNSIMVFTTYPGVSASDIENNISKPLENALNGLSDLKHITSVSKENFSIIFLQFEYGIDIVEATNDVRDKLDMIKSALPDGANLPYIFKFNTQDIPILILSVQSEESTDALYKILDDKVVSKLSRIKGVGTVSISGAPKREIQVYCDPYKLEGYGLTIEGIASTIGAENRNMPLGTMDVGKQTYSMRVEGEFTDAEQMNNIIVGSFNNQSVYLRDIATVKDTIQERMQEVYNDGVRGAMIIIQKQTGANSVSIAKEVYKELPKIEKTLPSDIKIDTINDTTVSILNTIDSLKESIYIILLLVVLVVLFFLGRWRATFIIIIVIPISLVASFIYLLISGNTLNIISLSSISLAIGMVVDDAIVVLENISTHIERGSKPKPAAVFATSEVSLSIIATTLVLFAVFLPLTMIEGMSGVLFQQLGWIVSIVMLVSMIAALSLTPMLSSLLLKNNPNRGKLFNRLYVPIEKFLDNMDNAYAKLLNKALNHRKAVVILSFLIFASSTLLVLYIPTEFFPTQDNASLSVRVKLPIGTSLETSRNLAVEISQEIKKEFPEIRMLNFSVGQPDETNTFGMLSDNGNHIIAFNIKLLRKTERKKGIAEISDDLRALLNRYPEIRTYTVATGRGGGMGGQSTVDIEIYGHSFEETDKFAADIAERMRKVKGCSQVNISRDEYAPEIQVDFDRNKLAENALNLSTVSLFVRNRFNGAIASYYREDGEEYDIRVRYAPEYRQDIEDIENILIYNNLGNAMRVKDIGSVVERMSPPAIERKDRERMVTVSCVVGKDGVLSEMAAAAEKELDQIEYTGNLDYKIGGVWEEQQESFADLISLMLLIVVLVYIVMASQFESFVYPFVIMFSIPFAFTGVFLGLAITNTPLGIMALLGAMMLIGIVVKNGIVLIDYTILCREREMTVRNAVVTAGRSRLRPILMTTLTTVLGMVPLAIGRGEGAEMWNAMGMTVAWGLSVSTLVTLVLIPILYSIFADFGIKRKQKKQLKN
ncbi:MAG: efflux RND transporter permease subunit [Bacteroidales bacterium]|jgi:HAE1 family hydrophobic/amphiphilic exporter-1